jgi:enoyl-CoA hydratase/carnithine racemase
VIAMPDVSQSSGGAVTERRDGAAVVLTLSRPERANAYTQAMIAALDQAIERAEADPAVGVIVITGEGERSFCAGADRDELASRDWRNVPDLPAARVFGRLPRSRCVSIAAINGAAVGGGFELALHCDIRVASDTARFWLPEPEFGLLPAAGGLRLLPLLAGPLRARDVILGGARWSATEAWQAGVVSEIAAPNQLWERVNAWIKQIALRDPLALIWSKRILSAAPDAGDHGLDRMAQSSLVRQRSKEK